ncbi:MAG: carbon starvation protein A [Candidatus Aminicenantes bacterium]|nr:carbon starvation protein A [Candidatus Aminicenantes bacterium]
MEILFLIIITFAGYIIAYRTYGRFLAKKVFKLNNQALVPSREFTDGMDFVPTRKGIIFGHHYTSIAGTGPIVGPAIGIIWGWIPALVWVFVGSIVMGAVHDFGALVISLRNQGKSISEITAKYIGPRVRYIFFLIVFFELLIVIAIFGLVIALIFDKFPDAVFPVWMQIPIALILGRVIYKRGRGGNVNISTAVAVIAMYATVILGHFIPFKLGAMAGIPATGTWTILLLIYAFIASTLPVTTLLQPRDYINAWQIFIAMGLLVLGIIGASVMGNLNIVAPAFQARPEGAPPIWPFLFITIACGAISGFHSLVSSGTSSKQVEKESDALFVGYGSMLMESALAVLVIIAVSAGIGIAYRTLDGELLSGVAAWKTHYASWQASSGLGSKIDAVVTGAANMMESIKIPIEFGIIIMGVFIASFAGTTLDTATRIQRYVVTELSSDIKFKGLTNKYGATAFAVITAAALAFATGADGSGALKLWPMFGAVNQLLAALGLLVLTIYLKRKGGLKFLLSAFPCVFMIIMTLWSTFLNEMNYFARSNWLLTIINGIIILLALWMVVESVIMLFASGRKKNS